LNLLLEDTDEKIIFAFEIKVNGTGCHSSLSGDSSHGCLVITILGKGSYGGIHNPVAFVIAFSYPSHLSLPLLHCSAGDREYANCLLNECSFIIYGT
jgi:hypothetical protein